MTAQSNVNAAIGCAVSLSSRIDQILNSLNNSDCATKQDIQELSSKIDSLSSEISSIRSGIDVINNAIDSLENVVVTAINSAKDIITNAISGLIDLLRQLLGGGNNDEILAAIDRATNAILDGLITLGRGIDRVDAKIDACCARIENLINSLIRDSTPDRTNEILAAISGAEGSIKESIGGAENNIIAEIGKIDCDSTDWINRILSAIAALSNLLENDSCDLDTILASIDGCCRLLEALIKDINFDDRNIIATIESSRNYLAVKIDSNTNTVNNISNTTNNISNTVNNISNTTNNISNDVNNISNTTNNISNDVNNISNTTNNISNDVNNISNTTNNISNITNQIDTTNITNQITDLTNYINTLSQQCINGGQSVGIEYKLIQVPLFVRCNPTTNEPEYTVATIKIDKQLEAQELLKFQRIAEIEGKQCKIVEPIALIPEWWQVRLEGGVPQFVVAFGEVDSITGKCTHAKYPITIPHFIDVKPLSCPFPRYKKGNYELIAYFKDNSKLIINAFNEYECMKVFDAIMPWIDTEYASSVKYKIGKRVSYPFKEVWVCPKFGKYFSTGNRESNPDWTVYYN